MSGPVTPEEAERFISLSKEYLAIEHFRNDPCANFDQSEADERQMAVCREMDAMGLEFDEDDNVVRSGGL